MCRAEQQWHLTGSAAIIVALTLMLVGLAVEPAAAQVSATVTGTVKDQQGGVLPGATVVLVSETRGTKTQPAVTNTVGDFVLPNVLPDTYTIQVDLPSFTSLKRPGLVIGAEPRVVVGTLTLEVGGRTDVVNVVAESSLVQTSSGERSFAVDRTLVENLPISNRNFTGLAGLAPGVDGTARVGGGGDNNVLMDGVSTSSPGNNAIMIRLNTESVAEVRVVTSSYQAEYGRASGLQISSVTRSGTNRIRGSVYDVERNSSWNSNSRTNILNGDPKTVLRERDFGFSVGGPVGKPGGNNKLFYFFSYEIEPRTSGNNVVRYRMPTDLERQGDFSRTTDNNGNLYPFIKNPDLPGACSAANQSACFADGGVLGRIPVSQLYGPGLALLNMFPRPNITNVPPGQNYNYELTRPTEDTTGWQPVLRLDYQPTSALRGTYRIALSGQPSDQIFNGTLPGFNDTQMSHPVITTQSWSVNYTMRPNMILDVTYGRTRNELSGCALGGAATPGPTFCTAGFPAGEMANRKNAGIEGIPLIYPDGRAIDERFYMYDVMNKLGLPMWDGSRIQLPPQFQYGSRVANAPPGNLLTSFYNTSLVQDFSTNLTIVSGRHTIKFGFWNLAQFQAQSTNGGGGAVGTLSFAQDAVGTNPFDTSFGFANAAIGTYSSYAQATRFSEYNSIIRSTEFYVQDNWKMNERLTLDYGVRFVHMVPDHDQFQQGSNFLPDEWNLALAPILYRAGCANGVYPCSGTNRQAMNPQTGQFLGPTSSVLIGTLVPGTGDPLNGIRQHGNGISENGYVWPALATAPRFGVAYDVTGRQRIVLRGSVGLFFDRTAANATRASASNPPNAELATLRFGKLQNLTGGLTVKGAPTLGGTWEYEADHLPSSTQWNAGVQLTLPFAVALDASYVGQHAFAQPVAANINAVDLGVAFLPTSQDPTLPASSTPGATSLSNDLLRAIRGYGGITQNLQTGWRTFHSLQFSVNRRFRNGVSFGFNETWSLYDHESTNPRFDHTADGRVVLRTDQAEADRLLGTSVDQVHLMRANFVWDLPDIQSSQSTLKAVALVLNDWQLSGLWTGRTGTPYAIGFSYQNGGGNVNLTGSPDYGARAKVTGDTGGGCSDDELRQFTTSAFQGPSSGSVGLESGNGYMRSCFSSVLDLSITRTIRLKGTRTIQLRADLFNAPNQAGITGRNANMNLSNPSDPTTITNLPFDANGQVIDARSRPRGAGFGVATNYQAPRTVQLQIRFNF